MSTAGVPEPSAGTTQTSVVVASVPDAGQGVEQRGVVEPLDLVVDAAGLGEQRLGAGGEVEHGEPPRPRAASPSRFL